MADPALSVRLKPDPTSEETAVRLTPDPAAAVTVVAVVGFACTVPDSGKGGFSRTSWETGGTSSRIAGCVSRISSIRFQLAMPRWSMFVTHPNAITGHD